MEFFFSGSSDRVTCDHVFAATVRAVLETFAGKNVLNDVENAQAARFVRTEDGERYHAAHLLKRHLLGRASGLSPQDLHFDRQSGGKPFLLGEERLDFNLSHGGDWVIAGLSWSGRIGVDVEAERPAEFWREIAGSFLSPAELAVADGDDFLKIWTAKEAGLKAHGAGFAIMPNAITVADGGDGFSLAIEAMKLCGVWQRLDETHMLAIAASNGLPQIAVCRNTDDLQAALGSIRPPVPGLPASR